MVSKAEPPSHISKGGPASAESAQADFALKWRGFQPPRFEDKMKRYLPSIIILALLAACAPATPTADGRPPTADQRPPTALPTTDPSLRSGGPPTALPTALPTATLLPKPTAPTTPTVSPRGSVDADFVVDVFESSAVWMGTTLLADNHNLQRPRIIEVNLLGEIVWQYFVPDQWRQFTNPGFDVEPLANGNVLFVLPRVGVFEIDRGGKTVWSHLDVQVSHDADRLPNGNTLVVFGNNDSLNDAQVKEVNAKGEIVWRWYARDAFNKSPYKEISEEGWTHANAVVRLANGNTLISLRNFHLVAEVDARGALVRTIGEGLFKYQHDPEPLANGNLLFANHTEPQIAIELDLRTNQIVWQFPVPRQLVRDANRLPNGNTLITGSSAIVEVTPQKQIVWQFRLKAPLEKDEGPARGFYKAERIASSGR
jgi:hypothetical protein